MLTSNGIFARIGKEAVAFIASALIAQALNIAAILIYKTHWRELYTQAGWLLVLTHIIYVVSILVRVGLFVARRLRQKQEGESA